MSDRVTLVIVVSIGAGTSTQQGSPRVLLKSENRNQSVVPKHYVRIFLTEISQKPV